MKTGSKRGAALAYVIVVSAALMILASALVFSAKFNLDSATNSLEGRQAYLDAKSAIEYGRAYVLQNPDAGSFTILKTSENSGFKIGSGENAVAEYDSTRKLIKASAKYRSSDRVRKLGYQFTTEEGKEDSDLPSTDFLALGTYGNNDLVRDYGTPQFLNQKVKSAYPVLFNKKVQISSGESSLTAPAVYFLGGEGEGRNLYGEWWCNMTLNANFLYIHDSFYSSFSKGQPTNCILTVNGQEANHFCFVYFKNDCKIYGNDGWQATIPSGLYKIKSGTNFFRLNEIENDPNNIHERLTEATDEETQAYQNLIDYGDSVKDASKFFSGDVWELRYGLYWSTNGKIVGNLTPPDKGSGNTPRYIFYKKQIAKDWIQVGATVINNRPGLGNYEEKTVFWYLNDVSEWGNALLGNNDQNSNEYYTNVSNIYLGKEINLLYVNASTDFKIPEYKTVVFKADSVTLNTRHSDTEAGSGDSQPKITHSGSTARFILEAQDPSDDVQLHVPNTLQVQYKDQNGIVRKYQIKAGWYEVRQLNLFSDDAKDFFNDTEPGDGPSGGSGSGGGGTEITGGVYTDGE